MDVVHITAIVGIGQIAMITWIKDVLLWLKGWLFDVFPALANFILVSLGVVMSLPQLAQKIEENPRMLRRFGIVCVIAGVVSFASDVMQRHTAEQQTKILMDHVENMLKNTNEVLSRTNDLLNSNKNVATNTSQMVSAMGTFVVPQLSAMNSQIEKLNKKAGMPGVSREEQERKEKQGRDFLAAMLVGIRFQLEEAMTRWGRDEDAAYWKAHDVLESTIATNSQKQAASDKRTQTLNQLDAEYSDKYRPLIVSADVIRQQLLQQIGSGAATDEDRREAIAFARGVAGETIKFTEFATFQPYLDSLSQRVTKAPNVSAGAAR